MKSLIIAGGVLSALVMTGCATNQTTKPMSEKHPHGEYHHTKDSKHHHGDRYHHGDKKSYHSKGHHGKHGEISKDYTCEGNATIKATYNPDDKKALLNVTAPSLNLNGEQISLAHTKDGITKAHKGHGFSFTNDSYQWHVVGKDGLLTLKTAQATQTLKCQTQHPIHHGIPKDHHHKMPKNHPHTKSDSTPAK